ncbi:hypothetical protein TNCV_4097231 [Trichonephila clavipes]|nr:hypothetical protein TNCV_4097231 [Trichonephila clavipes]
MAPYRRKKPAPTDYTTDEEDMITYDVEEDELEQLLNLVQKDATRGRLETDHVILNNGQVTGMTLELARPSPNYHTTPT